MTALCKECFFSFQKLREVSEKIRVYEILIFMRNYVENHLFFCEETDVQQIVDAEEIFVFLKYCYGFLTTPIE